MLIIKCFSVDIICQNITFQIMPGLNCDGPESCNTGPEMEVTSQLVGGQCPVFRPGPGNDTTLTKIS